MSHVHVPYYSQENSEWCWAATTKSVVAAVTGGTLVPEQCQLADIAFNRSDCCKTPTPQECLRGSDDFKRLLLQIAGIQSTRVEQPLNFAEIPDNGLVIYQILFSTGATHSGIISGKRKQAGKEQVYFLDPDEDFFRKLDRPPEGWVDYEWVLKGYNPPAKGNWLQSWTDIKQK